MKLKRRIVLWVGYLGFSVGRAFKRTTLGQHFSLLFFSFFLLL